MSFLICIILSGFTMRDLEGLELEKINVLDAGRCYGSLDPSGAMLCLDADL